MTALTIRSVQVSLVVLLPELRRFALSLTGSAEAGNELVQEAYKRAFSRPQSLLTVEEPMGWMRRTIRNIWIDEKRSSRDRLSVPLEDGEHVMVECVERTVIARSILARVRAEMPNLSEEQRSAILLVCIDGLSYKDAATDLGIPIGTLMSRLYRARLELARRVDLIREANAHDVADREYAMA